MMCHWKRLFLCLALVGILAACATPLSTVCVRTEPSGGTVQVLETGALVEDGGKISLPPGDYTLSPYQVPDSPGDVKVTLNGLMDHNFIVPVGSGQVLSTFDIHTEPAGGRVLVVENNRIVEDGGKISLPAGRYTLRPQKDGYRPKNVILDVGERSDETLLIRFGKGFAPVAITSVPAGAEVIVDGLSKGTAPLELELVEGDHQLQLSMNGYQKVEQSLSIEPGKKESLEMVLKEMLTCGRVSVQADASNTDIYFDGKRVGKGQVDLDGVAFGAYRVHGIRYVDRATRLTGSSTVSLWEAKTYPVRLTVNKKERLFEGKWLSNSAALKREADRYRKYKVANPVSLHVKVSAKAIDELDKLSDAVQKLHGIMRVGDRLVFESAGAGCTLWKRNTEPTPEFELAVAALLRRQKYNLPWSTGTEKRRASVEIKKDILDNLAFSLHRSRSEFPLLYLYGGQIGAVGEDIRRNAADGEITLLVAGGSGVKLPGKVETIGRNLFLARIGAGSGTLSLKWQKRPDRILVVSDVGASFTGPAKVGDLMANEKQILPIAKGSDVKSVIRLSSGPDYDGWKRQKFAPSGPFVSQIDLSQDEVGPHEHFGDYRRIWIVTYASGGGLTQRQVESAYKVVDQKKDFGSDKFLRRDGLGG